MHQAERDFIDARDAFARARYGEAAERLRPLAINHPDQPNIWYLLGTASYHIDDVATSLEAYQRVLTLDPGHVRTLNNLGTLLLDIGRAANALGILERGAALEPDNGDVLANLGVAQIATGDVATAMLTIQRATKARRGPDRPRSAERLINRVKLRHDIEQMRWLSAKGLAGDVPARALPVLEEALAALDPALDDGAVIEMAPDQAARLAPFLGRLLYQDEGAALTGPAVNPALDNAGVLDRYRASAAGVTYMDDVLTGGALAALRKFCHASTIWYHLKPGRGYLGALQMDGFACPLLAQIVAELRAAFPELLRDYPLTQMWAFKYSDMPTGVGLHADAAAINLNLWLTEDEANLTPGSSGLRVWDTTAPPDWGSALMQGPAEPMRQALIARDAKPIDIPYRANRLVLFNSDLFHETSPLLFKSGYENRRINVTFLFGHRAERAG